MSDCFLLLDVVALQPYWLCVASVLIFWLLSAIFNLMRWWCKTCKRKKKTQEVDETSQITSSLDIGTEEKFSLLEMTLKPNLFFLNLQSSYQLINIGFILYKTVTNQEIANGWDRYQIIYGRALSSGLLTMLCFLFSSASVGMQFEKMRDESPRYFYLYSLLLVLTLLLLLPPLLTHILPMGLAYFWIFPPILGYMVLIADSRTIYTEWKWHKCAVWLCYGSTLNDEDALSRRKSVLVKTLFPLFMILLFQSSFNYGVLLYGGHKYFLSPIDEFRMRSTLCYFESIQKSMMTFASFISALL